MKYSVIVPVYNMEKLLPKCIESLTAQRFADMEIILVDDCSTDNSYSICVEAAKKDNRIHVVCQKKNSGLSSTRNLGIKHAKGEYITFVDSDDYVESNFIQVINEKQKEESYDMIVWGMYNDIIYSNGKMEISKSDLNYSIEKRVVFAQKEDWLLLIMKTFFASTCLRFYKLDIIREYNLLFDPHCVDFEDYVFNIQYCSYVKSFLILEDAFYHYRQPYGQIATIKRKWSTVVPFDVSERVFLATEHFLNYKNYSGDSIKQIYFYVYKSYFSEIEYAYRTCKYKDFVSRVKHLADNPCFYKTLKQLESTNVRKYTKLLYGLIHMKCLNIFSFSLWIMQYKNWKRIKKDNLGQLINREIGEL